MLFVDISSVALAAFDPSTRLLNVPRHLTARMAAATRRNGAASCAATAPGGGLRATPTAYGGDPTGTVDSTAAVQKALAFCINASNHIPGKFPVGARDAGGCTVDLEGGEFLISEPLVIPTYTSDIEIGRGALVANPASEVWAQPHSVLLPEGANAASACGASSFPTSRASQWCQNLVRGYSTSAAECATECCSSSCEVWQWCPPGVPCYATTGNHSCWLGAPYAAATCAAATSDPKSIGWLGGSRVAPPTPAPGQWGGKFMIQVGGDVKCNHPQGSCNEDVGFPQLFLDGSHVAGGIQVNAVMGTTIGPTTYILNFTRGIEINGGHEVMVTEVWLGETNFDFVFNATAQIVPTATAIAMHSNDHYILNTIVFSALVGLYNGGAANMVSGLHVWFPENQAIAFGCTAFMNTGGKNRYDGCYIDGSTAVFVNPTDTTWLDGFVLGGRGFELQGRTASNFVLQNTVFSGGAVKVDPGMAAENVWIGQNPQATQGSAATLSVTSATPAATYTFDFCKALVFDTVEVVKSAVFSNGLDKTKFPVLSVGPGAACPGSTTAKKIVTVYLSEAAAGTVTLAVDSSAQSL
jgi:hypothetical protein